MGNRLELHINVYGGKAELDRFIEECQSNVLPLTDSVADYELDWLGYTIGLDRHSDSKDWYRWADWVHHEPTDWVPFGWIEPASVPDPGPYIQLHGVSGQLGSVVNLLESITSTVPVFIESYTRLGLDDCYVIEFYGGKSELTQHYSEPPEANGDERFTTWFTRDGMAIADPRDIETEPGDIWVEPEPLADDVFLAELKAKVGIGKAVA